MPCPQNEISIVQQWQPPVCCCRCRFPYPERYRPTNNIIIIIYWKLLEIVKQIFLTKIKHKFV